MSSVNKDGIESVPGPLPMSYATIIAQERAGKDRDGHNHELLFRATMQLAAFLTEQADAAEKRGNAIDASLEQLRAVMPVRVA